MILPKSKFLDELEKVEQRFQKDRTYTPIESDALYRRFIKMTAAKWKKLCNLIILKGGGYLPPMDEFSKMYAAHGKELGIVKKVHVLCDDCDSTGIRMYLHRRGDGAHGTPPAKCTCQNGENWPNFPTIAEAETQKGWVRWLSKHESLSEAIFVADGFSGARPKEEPKPEEIKIDESVPF